MEEQGLETNQTINHVFSHGTDSCDASPCTPGFVSVSGFKALPLGRTSLSSAFAA